MHQNPTTPAPGAPPLIWTYNPIASEEIISLALAVSFRANLAEDKELAGLLIKLLAAVTVQCGDGEECHVWLSTWLVMNVFFGNTRQGNDALYNYLVNDLKVAHAHSEEGGEQ